MKKALGFVLGMLVLQGCVTTLTPHVSTIQYDPNTMVTTPVYVTEGIVEFLGLPLESDTVSVQFLIKKACYEYKVDTVINTCVDSESSTLLGLITSRTVRLTGLGVKFK